MKNITVRLSSWLGLSFSCYLLSFFMVAVSYGNVGARGASLFFLGAIHALEVLPLILWLPFSVLLYLFGLVSSGELSGFFSDDAVGSYIAFFAWSGNILYGYSVYCFSSSKINRLFYMSVLALTLKCTYPIYPIYAVGPEAALGKIDNLEMGYYLWVLASAILVIYSVLERIKQNSEK